MEPNTGGTLTLEEFRRVRGVEDVERNGNAPAPTIRLCSVCSKPARPQRKTCGSRRCVAAHRAEANRRSSAAARAARLQQAGAQPPPAPDPSPPAPAPKTPPPPPAATTPDAGIGLLERAFAFAGAVPVDLCLTITAGQLVVRSANQKET